MTNNASFYEKKYSCTDHLLVSKQVSKYINHYSDVFHIVINNMCII